MYDSWFDYLKLEESQATNSLTLALTLPPLALTLT